MNLHLKESVTLMDVARTAEVSIGTVSRVLNGKANIDPLNVERVRQAMKALGYQKREVSGAHSRRRSNRSGTLNIGLVFAEIGKEWQRNSLVSAYAMGVEQGCQEIGFNVLVEMLAEGQSLPRCVRESKVDGLLVKSTRRIPEFIKALPEGFPVVGIGFNAPDAKIHQVAPDDRGAGWLVTDYLWRCGHRRIAFVANDEDHPLFIARMQGYEAYLREKGAFCPSLVILSHRQGNWKLPEDKPQCMRSEVNRILAYSTSEPVTAIIAANDWMARGLYIELDKRGISIPQDMSVVGFDNTVELCSSLHPALTSYGMPFAEVGRLAVQALMSRIDTPSLYTQRELHLVRGRVVERASVRTLESGSPAIDFCDSTQTNNPAPRLTTVASLNPQ